MEEKVVARFRASLVFSFLLVLLAALAGRLFWIQVLRHEEFAASARSQHLERVEEPAPRGDILDARGRVLATSRLLPSVAVDPARLRDPAAAAAALAAALGVDEGALRARIAAGRRFAWVRRRVDDPEALARVFALDLARVPEEDPLVVRQEMSRCYPMGPLAAQVLGFVGIDGEGLEGIERSLDAVLRGEPGERTVFVDALGTPIGVPGAPGKRAVRGRDVPLALDAVIQGFAEDQLRRSFEKHDPKGAVCVVLDARTGAVLALASEPGYDPADPGRATPESRRARFATDMMEPGSTFKPLVAAAAIEAGAVGAEERIDTGEGWFRIGKRVVHEHEARGYGAIPVGKVLAVSSNCGMAKIGLRLGIPRMQGALAAYGFGAPTGVPLPGESSGKVTPPDRWTEAYTLVSVSFGQEIAVTPLQLAAAYLPLAGDGTRPAISLLRREPGAPPPPRVRVLSEATARRVRGMLEQVVTEGTARSLAATGYRLGGKTGTAQKMAGGDTRAYVSSFVGIGPIHDPRLVCLVMLDEPSRRDGVPYGSRVAAPYCGEILRRSLRYLGVRPDVEGEDRP